MLSIDPAVNSYCISKSHHPSPLCKKLEKYTQEHIPYPQMIVGELEASILGFLIRSIQAKKVLEFGTFTGYSALTMAENLPEDGEVITLDINPETTKVAKEYWEQSPHGKKIKSLLGPAVETAKSLKQEFDFIFIDADKVNYLSYFQICLEKLSSKGIIAIDNVLWSGQVLKENHQDENTRAIQEVNNFISKREDLYSTLLPVRDGLFLIQKKQY
jgi:caffeoyl-CoA O-methyltransferase